MLDTSGRYLQVHRTADQVMRTLRVTTLEVSVYETTRWTSRGIEDHDLHARAMDCIRRVDALLVMFTMVEIRDGLLVDMDEAHVTA